MTQKSRALGTYLGFSRDPSGIQGSICVSRTCASNRGWDEHAAAFVCPASRLLPYSSREDRGAMVQDHAVAVWARPCMPLFWGWPALCVILACRDGLRRRLPDERYCHVHANRPPPSGKVRYLDSEHRGVSRGHAHCKVSPVYSSQDPNMYCKDCSLYTSLLPQEAI
jgi:hypothetical protein